MTYDGQVSAEPFSLEWFNANDHAHIFGSRLFATTQKPFDRIIPFDRLAGRRVLEIGCGMGLHTELMARAGATVTAIDITPTGVEATRRRLALKGLDARVLQQDAENLPFDDASFDFVWSWGVIHHSARTARIVRQISRILTPTGECRVMVYNREGMSVRVMFLKDHLLRGGFLRRTFDETLSRHSDAFAPRFYIRDHFEDLFRAFFSAVTSEICGMDVDSVPLPRKLRTSALRIIPDSYLRTTQARRGSFIFLKAANPV